MRALELKFPPPIVGGLIAFGMWLVAEYPPTLAWDSTIRFVAAGLLSTVGLSIDVAGVASFMRRKTTVNPMQPGKTAALVTTGVYSISRNPMYTGFTLVLTAWGVYLSALWPLLGPVLFVLYITRFQIVPEERMLREKFGDAFVAYSSRVRRWL